MCNYFGTEGVAMKFPEPSDCEKLSIGCLCPCGVLDGSWLDGLGSEISYCVLLAAYSLAL